MIEVLSRHTFLKSLATLWISIHPAYTKNDLFDRKREYVSFLQIPIPGASTFHQALMDSNIRETIQTFKQSLVMRIPPYIYHKLLCRIPEPFDTSIRIAWYYGPEPKATHRLGAQYSNAWRFDESLGVYILDDIRTVPRITQDRPQTNEIFLPKPPPERKRETSAFSQ